VSDRKYARLFGTEEHRASSAARFDGHRLRK
jgi:hypothetical protein